MTLKVIGTGLGRTGTMSLKLALEQLGLGPCHHMVEVFMHPQSMPQWVAAGQGKPDWEAICEGYVSMVDHPGCKFWRELMDYYPDAKLIHTVRDPNRWFDSTQATIFGPDSPAVEPAEPMREFFNMVLEEYEGRQNDRDYMLEHFQRHTDDVLATVPPERLLVFEAGQGWEPLCAFLGVSVPGTPYPHENSTADFQARLAGGPLSPEQVKAAMDAARSHAS
ncbi:MAG TPA: sulfotransferase [Caulobacteraceae bacterium]